MSIKNNSRLESLIELASILGKQNNFREILRLVGQKASSWLRAETALVMMINPRTRETVKTLFMEGNEADNGPYQFAHTYLSGWVIAKNRGVLSKNVQEDSRFNMELFKDSQLKSVICVPFFVEGIIIGTLLLLNKTEGEFSESDYSFLEKFTTIVSPYLRDVEKTQQYFTAPLPQESLLKKYEVHGLLGKSQKFIELLQTI